MAELTPIPPDQPTTTTPQHSGWHIVRWLVSAIAMLLILALLTVGYLVSTDNGSRLLLNWVMTRQGLITYKYHGGNILRGLSLSDIHVQVKQTEVNIDHAKVRLGWRALLKKQLHFMTAEVGTVDVINHAPPNDEPFKFNELKLPFTLVLDDANLKKLHIKSAKSNINFYDVNLHNAEWSGVKIQFVDSSFRMEKLNANKATGYIELNKKYPLNLTGIVRIPALQGLNMKQISVAAHGDVDTLKVGVASATPDIIAGYVILHPVQKHTPMLGKLSWVNFRMPFAQQQQLFSKAGSIAFNGTSNGLNLKLISDIVGKNIPQGQYQLDGYTDFKRLDITQFMAQTMGGQINLTGNIGWKDGLHWDIAGAAAGLNPRDPHVPQSIQPFLPPNLDASLVIKGQRGSDTHTQTSDINAEIKFKHFEKWQLHALQSVPIVTKANPNVIADTKIDATQPVKAPSTVPWMVNIHWQDFNRAVPYIGWLNSQQGQAQLAIGGNKGHDIQLSTQVAAHDGNVLPVGRYQALLNINNSLMTIKDFRFNPLAYTQAQSHAQPQQLSAQGTVQLPNKNLPLKWNARLNAQHFNPQLISDKAPLNFVNGSLNTSGYQKDNQYIIQLSNINLNGQIVQDPKTVKTQNVSLDGASTIALIMPKNHRTQSKNQTPQQGLQGFAVRYNGHLKAQNYSQGPLRLNLSGTPKLLNISELYHQGAAGLIHAKGKVDLSDGIAWNLQAQLEQFKPQFFNAKVNGNLSGQFATHGQWSAQYKNLVVQNLNLRGTLNGKPLLGQGNLAVNFKDKKPQQFNANDLVISYAGNVIHANGTGQRMQVAVNAQHLAEVYEGLHGNVQGFLTVQAQPQLHVQANLIGQNVGFRDTVNINTLRLVGTIPTGTTPTQFVANLNGIKNGNRVIDQAQVLMQGNRQAHLIKFSIQNKQAQFYSQLAGGLTAQNDWLGQLQQGSLKSKYAAVRQLQPATLIYRNIQQQVSVGAHCWANQARMQGQLCLSQPLVASKANGAISVTLKDIELSDFTALMPSGFSMQGRLNGYSHIVWQNSQPMRMESVLTTQNGKIGLSGDEDTDVPPATLDYRQIRLTADTLPQGLSLRINANTEQLGTAFADVLIGNQPQHKTLTGSVALDQIKLSVFRPFIKDARVLDGNLSAAGTIAGTLQQPQFNGEIRLKDGRFALISAPVNLTNIQVSSSIRGSQAVIAGGFNAGRGVGQITGQADWSNVPLIRLSLKGQDLLVAQPPTISASVTPKIDVEIRPTLKQLNANGTVNVPRAVILMPESSADVIATSPDVRIVRDGVDQLAILKAAKPWDIRANIAVTLGDAVVFRGFNSSIPLVGKLNLTQRGRELAMQAHGAIGAGRQVKIEAYGQSLDLNRAIARFGGELSSPTLDIDATKSIQNNKVGVRVTGTASRPTINIYNDAGLSEQEALNALLTGHISSSSAGTNTEGFKSDVNNTIAAAGLSLGLGGTRALTNSIGRSFGLSGLALDAQGTGNDTQVSLTGYITPDLYLRYGVGIFTPVNKLTLRYQVNRRMYIEASSSVERAVDIFYNWRY